MILKKRKHLKRKISFQKHNSPLDFRLSLRKKRNSKGFSKK
tara:strand:+ start:681 stop:803 length:123 start_codon:yes stop_codon:yes gene_type:complete